MLRREFLHVLGGAAATWPVVARAQKSTKVPRVGYLGYSAPALEQHRLAAFQQGLRDAGYIEGTNVTIEYRSAEKA
jgi:putative ABC transport system substrate-binding protein